MDSFRHVTFGDRKQRLDQFFEQSPLGVIRWDDEFNFDRLPDTVRDILGYDEGELGCELWEAVVPAAEREEIGEVGVSDLLANEDGDDRTNENVRKDGDRIIREWHNWVITDNNDELMTVYSRFQDFTERRRHDRRLDAIFNNTHIFVGLLEPDGTLLEANETALRSGDVNRGEVVGKPIREACRFEANEEARAATRSAVQPTRDGELSRDEIQVRGSTEEVFIDFSVRPVFAERGDVTLPVPEGRDITDRKERERELQETKAQLEATVTEKDRLKSGRILDR